MRIRVIVLSLVTALVVVTAVWAVTARPASRREDGTDRGLRWSSAVAGVARHVEQVRGLQFDHRVPVTFLGREALAARYHRSGASWQAAYEIDGFYDSKRDSVYVLGAEGAVESRVLLAHELTHVLQDQNFDIPRLGRRLDGQGSPGVLRNLQEGDAQLVFDAYAAQLEANGTLPLRRAERLGYAGPDGPMSTTALERLSPYVLAPSALRVYRAGGTTGNSVDNLYRHPPRSDDAFLTPSKLFDDGWNRSLPAPKPDPGDGTAGRPYLFGALETYLMLASKLEPEAALRIADGWADGVAVDFRRGHEVCSRIALAGNSAAADTAFADGLAKWDDAGGANDDDIVTTDSSSRFGPSVTVTRCRDRDRPRPPVRTPMHLLLVPTTRNHIEAELVATLGAKYAECVADGYMDSPSFDALVHAAEQYPTRVPAQIHRERRAGAFDDLALTCAGPRSASLA